MSKDQEAYYLCYGQGILLYGFKENDGKGLLTAKGFADTKAKYETFKDILYFKNYRNAIFQIIPAANFEINDEKRKFETINSDKNSPNLNILKARATSQQQQFLLNIANKEKSKVCFGDLIMFKHVDSDTYLSGTIKPAEGKNGAFTVQVTKELSEILIFQILPFRSFESIGMTIPFDSPVKLLNIYNNGFLTYEKIGITLQQKKIDLDKKPIQADDSYIIPVKTNSAESEIYQTVTHFVDLSHQTQDPMPWKFELHMNQVENDSLLQHDIIYFEHTESQGILSTQGKQIILKEMKDQKGDQLPFFECLWEVEKQDSLANENLQSPYILRHLMSGMTLGIVRDENDKPTKPQLFDISEGSNEKNIGVISLNLAKKQVQDINSGSLINICYNDWCLDKVKSDNVNEMQIQEEKPQQYVSISKLNQMSVNQLEYQVKKVKFTLEISKNCFVIKEIEDSLKKQVLFALSFHSKIIDLREDLKWGHEESEKKIPYKRMMAVTDKIKQIKNFLKDCDDKQKSDLEYIKPIFKRQMICKDLGISELLFQLLFYMRKNLEKKFQKKEKKKKTEQNRKPEYIFEFKHNELEKFEELYNSIYEVIYELVRDNLLFKIHVSKWINFVFEDVLTENQPNHLKLLKQILKNNEFLVNNFVTDKLMNKLAERMINQKDNFLFVEKKYLEIFRLFCIVGESINTGNQIKILNHFIKQLRSDEIKSLYQVTVSKNDGKIFTEAAIDKNMLKKRPFEDYYKICKEEYITAWDYFVEFLLLAADMTKGRNKTVEGYLETLFSLDILGDLLEKHDLYESEVAIIRLLHNLHAQSQKYYPIEKNKRISNFDALKKETIDVMSTQSPVKPWLAPLNRVLVCLKKKLKKYGPIDIDPKKKMCNLNLLEILRFFCQSLNLGFWEKKQDVAEILGFILQILQPHPSIVKNYSQASIETQQNSLMMSCKEECMKIVQLILDYDVDLAVRELCKHFQNFQVPIKQRQLIEDDNSRLLQARIESQLPVKFLNEIPPRCIQLVQTSILQNLIELSKYNNPRLTSQSISIMQRVLLKQRKSVQFFCQQVFVVEDEKVAFANYIEEKKNKFYCLEDQTLVEVSMQSQAGNYVYIYKEDNKDSGVMQDIFMMSQLAKNEHSAMRIRDIKTLQTSRTFKQLGVELLINFTDERTSSNEMKQSVLDAENIHAKVLQYIFNCKEIPTSQLALKLLHLCYRFLVSLIWNYQKIKPSLIKLIPQMQHHIKKNVGCIDFLKEMYDNNKTMLFNQAVTSKLVKQICTAIENQPEGSYYKSKLLDFFRFLIYCNGKSIKSNQVIILKIMQDDSYKKIIIPITKEKIETLVKNYQTMNTEEADKDNDKCKIDSELLYLITYFQILESLIDDNNSVNLGKIKKRFPFDSLVDWIEISKDCWPLKRNIRCFLNRTYYFQPEIQIYMKKIINFELKNIIQDLNYYIKIKHSSNVNIFEETKFENPVRFTYLESYLYLNFEQNLFTLYMLNTSEKIEAEMKNILHPLDNSSNDGPYNFIRICQRLGCIRNYFTEKKNTFCTNFIKFLLTKFKKVIEEFDDNIYLPGMKMQSGLGRAPTKPEKETARVGLIQKIMAGEINSYYAQDTGEQKEILPLVYQAPDKPVTPKDDKKTNTNKLLKKLRQILKREKRMFKNKDEEEDYKLNRLVRSLKLSPEVDKHLVNQSNQRLSSSFPSGLDEQSTKKREEIFTYIQTIIQMNSNNPQALPIGQKTFFLSLITGIVEQSNKQPRDDANKPIDEWQAEEWTPYRESIVTIQNNLKGRDLGKFIIELLKQNIYDNIEFADSILVCGISYLFGGNTSTQNNIIEEIDNDSQNKVMRNLEALISKLGKFILKNIEQSNNPVSDGKNAFSITTIDNWDFYDKQKKFVTRKNVFEPETIDEQIYYKASVRTYRRAFKFLQLLCENNNTEGKNRIREQKRGVIKFDFINIATKQIRNLFQAFNKDIVDVTKFLMDFILEVTQFPIKLNQQALMNVTFFEDLCSLQNNFCKPEQVILRGFQGRQNLIDDIYFKAIQIILSNFEGNQSKTFQNLDNKLQPKFLVNVMKKKFKDMRVTSKESLIEYISKNTKPVFDQNMMVIINILTVFMKLKENLGEQNSRVYSMYSKEKSDNEQLFGYLEKCLVEIQINNNGKYQAVLFPRHPVFHSLSGNLRDTIMQVVQRDSHRDKIVSLLSYSQAIKSKINQSYRLLKEQSVKEANMNDAFRISAITSVIICIYMLVFYNVIISYQEADYEASRYIGLVRFSLSLMQLSMSLVYGFYWIKFKIWEQPQAKNRQSGESKTKPAQEEDQNQEYEFIKKIKNVISYVCQLLRLDQVWNIIRGGKDTNQPLYKSPEFFRVFGYICISIFGTFFNPALFFIHLIDIFCYNKQIGDIFKAVGLNIKEMLLVSFMGVVFTFIFCTVTFSNYMKDIYKQEEDDMCADVISCVMKLNTAGVIGQAMEDFELVRYTYDVVYMVFFDMLFGSIFSGIMLDAFASLREQNDKIDEDKQNLCYICNIKREELEKDKKDFQEHVSGNHKLWNYIFYIYYLEAKSETDFSGLEYEIRTQYNKPDQEMNISWVPQNEKIPYNTKQVLESWNEMTDQKKALLADNYGEIENSIKEFNMKAKDYLL